MKGILILSLILVGISTTSASLCETILADRGGVCVSLGTCNGETIYLGSTACPTTTPVCCVPAPTTTESTTHIPSTQPPTTTETPTTTPSTTVLPVIEQCGVKPEDDLQFRLLSGTDAGISEWPWMISIRGKSDETGATAADQPTLGNTKHVCSGVLIHEQYVVTTGFCIMKLFAFFIQTSTTFDPLKNILLLGGETDHEQTDFDPNTNDATEKILSVSEIIPHGGFVIQDFTTGYDVLSFFGEDNKALYEANNLALLKLSAPVAFTQFVRKCCGPNTTESCGTKKTGCYVAGWGDNSDTIPFSTSSKLREAEVEVFSSEVVQAAAQLNSGSVPPLQSMARFKNPPGGVCDRDNGGMVVCKNSEGRWGLEGIVSLATIGQCAETETFSITDINAAWDWIDSIISA